VFSEAYERVLALTIRVNQLYFNKKLGIDNLRKLEEVT